MDVLVGLICGVECERLSREPTEALLVNENLKWVDARDKNVDSQVELIAIQE